MYKAKMRTVQFFQFKLSCKSGGVNGLTPSKLVDLLADVERLEKNKLCRDNRAQTITTYLTDISINQSKTGAVLLLHCSDRLAADTVLTRPRNKTRREVKKEMGEGQDYSSHIVVNLTPLISDPDSYEVAIESAPTLPLYRIQQYLNYLFRSCTHSFSENYKRPHPDGSKNKKGEDSMIKVINHVEIRVVPSDELIADLNRGSLSHIELITTKNKKTKWDDGSFAVEEKRIVHLKPELTNFIGRKIDLIKKICGVGVGKHYELMKINFKLPNKKHQRTAYFNTNDASPLDERYVKREFIDFDLPLPASSETINNDIVGKIQKLM